MKYIKGSVGKLKSYWTFPSKLNKKSEFLIFSSNLSQIISPVVLKSFFFYQIGNRIFLFTPKFNTWIMYMLKFLFSFSLTCIVKNQRGERLKVYIINNFFLSKYACLLSSRNFFLNFPEKFLAV